MSINITFDEYEEVSSVSINGETLDSEDGEVWYCPKSILKDVQVNDLPENIKFLICREKEESTIVFDTLPMEICKINDSEIYISFEEMEYRKYWDAPVGLKRYMETKKAIIEERSENLKDLQLDSYDDDGAYIIMKFSTIFNAEYVINAVEQAELLIEEIEGATSIALEMEPINLTANNESDFSRHIILPILRKLGFTNIKYNHGKREYGKDFVFARITEFDELEHWGAQVKFGDVSGGSNSQIEELISQAQSAFQMPFYSIYTRRHEKISKFVIIISGKYTENAIERVCEGIESNALKNNIVFIDGDKIEIFKDKYFKTKLP